MSQFIQTRDKLLDWQQMHVNLVKGVFSQILTSTSPPHFDQTSLQRYFYRSMRYKIQQEQEDAFHLHSLTMLTNYQQLRKKLSVYARSKFQKIERLFQSRPKEREQQKQSDQIKKTSVKAEKIDRIVFIDRKYNKELVTKTAMLTELESIQKMKQNCRRAKSVHHSTPLLNRMNLERKSHNPFRQKQSFENPLLRKRQKTLKKRQRHIGFAAKSQKGKLL